MEKIKNSMKIEKKVNKKELIENNLSHLDLYSYYMPWKFELNKRCSNPYMNKDENPSFIIYYRDNSYFHKAFNSFHKGDIWTFLMELSGKSFEEVLDGIISDFGLLETSKTKLERIVLDLPKIEKKVSIPPKITCEVYSRWQKQHIDYLAQYYLIPEDLNFCSDTKCYPIKQFYFNNSKFSIKKNEPAFVYNVGNFNKVYLPTRPKGEKFWSNIPFTHIHGLNNLRNCETGVLTKSIKGGAFIHKYITKCVSVIQAENSSAISKENIEYVRANCKNLYIALDCDEPGKKASREICKLFGAKHINPIDDILKLGGSDFEDWAKLTNVETIRNHFIKKGIC